MKNRKLGVRLREFRAGMAGAFVLLVAAGCAVDSTCEGDDCVWIDTAEDEHFPRGNQILRTPSIPVCWENPSAADATGRAWVQNAVTNTWDAGLRVNFTGWGTCAATSTGVRIRIEDVAAGPRTDEYGRALAGLQRGMSLNFTFNNWGQSCKTDPSLSVEKCIRSIGVHEFGHVLGFAHEQNRQDRPASRARRSLVRGT